MRRRQAEWPCALSATATHDSKRGEDVRARLNVISEIPGAWKASVMKWRALNRRLKVDVGDALAPDANEEYLLYQTLVGAWPFDGNANETFRARIVDYMVKAMREAKVHTSWLNPNEAYEAAVKRFVAAILDGRRAQPFLQAFLPFQSRVAEHGTYNSLAQLVIKIAAPGVPDFYQGTELWDLSLVDPDNRRPVDYGARREALRSIGCAPTKEEGALAAELLANRADGRIKLFTMTRALAARRSAPDLFAGEYLPLETAGAFRDSVFAFARRHGDDWAIACVPRLTASVVPDGATPPVGAVWADTTVRLPDDARALRLRDALSGRGFEEARELRASDLFERLPVALLMSRR
jgi:(1->4)-alpha-D-glucan 1-alpha-D-glucosylmutase